MPFPELTLTVQDDRRVQARRDDGAEAVGDLQLDDAQYDLVELFADWLTQEKITARREMELFGALMYRALINGNVQTLFEQTLNQVAPGERLRLQLSFQREAAKLAGLPWEFLYRPDAETRAGFFLATSDNLALSRYIPLQTGRLETLKPAHPPLRMLFAVTQSAALHIGASQPVIEAAQQLANVGPVEVHILAEPTRDNLLDTLLDYQPHVFHFITRGRFDKNRKEGEIALLADGAQGVDWVEDKQFADFFTPLKGMTRLVFLHLGEGGAVDFTANFAGLAPQLIRANVQAVAAMQYPITQLAAATFSTRFYRHVLRGAPVDEAVQASRWRLSMAVDDKTILLRDFGAPALYMRSRDGLLQPAAAPASTTEMPDKTTAPADIFTAYETGLGALLARLGPSHARHGEALVYQQRLLENVGLARAYGDTETRRAERAEVIARLNALAQAELQTTFNALCAPAAPTS